MNLIKKLIFKLLAFRKTLSVHVSRFILPEHFTIISDDCWGGQIYRQLKLPYNTPTVGLWIKPACYLKFVERFEQIHKEIMIFKNDQSKSYPVGLLDEIEINFMHYENAQEAVEKYYRRFARISKVQYLIKIDFGKPGYTMGDIEKWNVMKLPNSLALYPETLKIPEIGIHNGLMIKEWELNGEVMFDISRKYFNIFKWINHGQLETDLLYKVSNFLLFDPNSPKLFFKKISMLLNSVHK